MVDFCCLELRLQTNVSINIVYDGSKRYRLYLRDKDHLFSIYTNPLQSFFVGEIAELNLATTVKPAGVCQIQSSILSDKVAFDITLGVLRCLLVPHAGLICDAITTNKLHPIARSKFRGLIETGF